MIGAGVVVLSTCMGAGALLLMRRTKRSTSSFLYMYRYTLMTASTKSSTEVMLVIYMDLEKKPDLTTR